MILSNIFSSYVVFYLFFISGNFDVNDQIPNLNNSKLVLSPVNEDVRYVLYVHSSHKCSFCLKARRDFDDVDIKKNTRIIFLEYDTEVEKIELVANTYKGQEVRSVSKYDNGSIKIFPTFQLYDTEKYKVIKKKKGYAEGELAKILPKE